jgi:hypothetical protein
MDPDALSEAVLVWVGRGERSWPHRDDDRLIERYGNDQGRALAASVRGLYTDFCASDAKSTVADYNEMVDAAEARFRSLHPELTDEAVDALTWCYSFDFK